MIKTCKIIEILLNDSRKIFVVTKPIDQGRPEDLVKYRDILFLRREDFDILPGAEFDLAADETELTQYRNLTPFEELHKALEEFEQTVLEELKRFGRFLAAAVRGLVRKMKSWRKRS